MTEMSEQPSQKAASTQLLQSGECADIKVDAADPWNRSGIMFEQGAVYTFRVISVDEPWVDDKIPSTPDQGWTTWHRIAYWPFRFLARYPSRNWYTLIGAIGEEKKHFFYLGTSAKHTATASGEFMCFANDKMNKYHNNHGRLTLRICQE
jgi:hypothetical protein